MPKCSIVTGSLSVATMSYLRTIWNTRARNSRVTRYAPRPRLAGSTDLSRGNGSGIYPAERQAELQLGQPAANAHPRPNAEGKVRERVDLFLLKPSFGSKLTRIFKVFFIRPQHLGVEDQHCLKTQKHVALKISRRRRLNCEIYEGNHLPNGKATTHL